MGVVLILLCVALVALPPRFDPAIRIKERQLRQRSKTRDGAEP